MLPHVNPKRAHRESGENSPPKITHSPDPDEVSRSVKCPNPICQSTRVRAINTYQHDAPNITSEFSGLNITRRRRICDACNETFHTIEISEDEFAHLRRKTGRLEVSNPSLRPGMVK